MSRESVEAPTSQPSADPAATPAEILAQQIAAGSVYELYIPPRSGQALSYPLLELPPWRAPKLPPTSRMLEEITRQRRSYLSLPERGRQWIEKAYSRIAAVQWVLSSNRLEGLGTQDEATTRTLLDQYYERELSRSSAAAADESAALIPEAAQQPATQQQPVVATSAPAPAQPQQSQEADAPTAANAATAAQPTDTRKRQETLQTIAAMSLLYANLQKAKAEELLDRVAGEYSGGVQFNPNDVLLLDDADIRAAHTVLTHELMSQKEYVGMIRGQDNELGTGGGFFESHSWPAGGTVESLLMSALDDYAHHVSELGEVGTVEHTTQIFQLAAWLLFQFVNIHPFMDGNGRMCRLLANRVLAVIFPFPVPIDETTTFEDAEGLKLKFVVQHKPLQPTPFIKHFDAPNFRTLYLALLEACRHRPGAKEQPIELCTLLIENGWYRWQHAMDTIPVALTRSDDLISHRTDQVV